MKPIRDCLALDIDGRRWTVGAERYDLSIPLQFDRPQPVFFGVAGASERTVAAGGFIGDVRRGGSCNCATFSLTPHCNGTHTECVGHITGERLSVRALCEQILDVALLITIEPVRAAATTETSDPAPQPHDMVITQAALDAAIAKAPIRTFAALAIRTLPNANAKQSRNYDAEPAPFFTAEAMRYIVARGVQHLIVDLPSLDRANDAGRLTAHRIFWNVPSGERSIDAATRVHATVTELAYIDDTVRDGAYLLNLQVAPFEADAAPSRPILLPLIPA
jgi:arylformamidase